jgi:hypothetical protein
MAPAIRNEDVYNTPGSFIKSTLKSQRSSTVRRQRKLSTISNLKHSRSSSIGRNENEASTRWYALESHLSKRMAATRNPHMPRHTHNDRDEKANSKFEVITPLKDLRQFDYSSTRSTPLSFDMEEEGSWYLERKKESSSHRLPFFRNSHFASSTNASSKTELDELMVKSIKPLGKQKLNSPVKGAKGALGWLIKPFAKDLSTGKTATSPGSTFSKPSIKSFEPEHFESSILSSETTCRIVRRRWMHQDTPEFQQRRWLLQVHRAIRDGAVREVIVRTVGQNDSLRSSKHPFDEKHGIDSKTKTRDSSSESGIFEEPTVLISDNDAGFHYPTAHRPTSPSQKPDYGAYSTFDDEQSVSSIELLFNWLTCRDMQLDDRRHVRRYDRRPEGMEFDLETTSTDPYTQKKSVGFCR